MKTKLTSVDYLGFTAVDRRFSTSMLPWILLEIRQRGTRDKLCLAVEGGALLSYDVNFELQFTHKLQNIMRFTQVQSTPTEFLYLVKDSKETLLYCFLFQAQTPEDVSELFTQMKEFSPHGGSLQSLAVPQTSVTPPDSNPSGNVTNTSSTGRRGTTVATNRGFQTARAQQTAIENQLLKSGVAGGNGGVTQSKSYSTGLNKSGTNVSNENGTGTPQIARSMSNTTNLTSLCADISPCNSHFFEVLYIGKIKVSHKKVPETLIDDALAKFKQFELEKMKAAQMRRNSLLSTQSDSIASENGSQESLASQHLIKRVDFAPLPLPHSIKKKLEEQSLSKEDSFDHRINEILMTPSLTPLRGDKQFFPDEDIKEKLISSNPELNIEKEFDELSKVRVQKAESENNSPKLTLNKKSFPIALEPNVLVLNWNQNESVRNLSTLTEDDNEGVKENSLPPENLIGLNFEKKTNNEKNELPKEVDLNMNIKSPIVQEELNKIHFPIQEKKPVPPKDLVLNQDMNGNVKDKETESGFVLKKEDSIKSDVDFGSTDSNLSETKDYFNSKMDEGRAKPGLKGSMMPENKPFARDRSASIGTLELNKTPIAQLIGDQNRTMLFQVGRSELRLISPDRKQVLLHRRLRDVASCAQGVKNIDHFGFICREPGVECFAGYVFKCQSEGVACDIVGAITQAFVAHTEMVKQGKEKSPIFSCEHCPMVWYHKLCQDLEGLSEKRMHAAILRRIEQLPDEEQDQIVTKYQGGTEDLYEVGEHNAFLMMLLRAHCEAKQQRHVHDTAENRSEFLNQYLGGSTIFMKAKRSLSSSFDHLLKRKASKDDFGQIPKDIRKETSPMSHALTPTRDSNMDLHLESTHSGKSNSLAPTITRQRTSSTGDTGKEGTSQNGGQETNVNGHHQNGHEQSPQLKSPMMDIFMKLGSSPSPKAHSPLRDRRRDSIQKSGKAFETEDRDESNIGSWRQAIFNRITQKGIIEELEAGDQSNANGTVIGSGNELLRRPPSFSNLNQAHPKKRDRAELRELWKKGINQAILLIRMEKENARLRARQEVSAVKRIKLEYEDIGGCANENSKLWDVLTAPRDSRISTKIDTQMLLQAIRTGVPRAKRGEVWYFLAEQFCLRQPPPDTKNFPNYGTPYDALLKQLTSHQHAILIDLGRTFPSHTYFSSPMGPGQLALFNLLKAYSLLDPEVGYCQGLSFVAGVLLLHLDETEAFLMLRHLMFRRGLRRQYLPDMIALQIELYQLSRLLKDHLPELYDKFDQYDVSPTLYAAPWILTIFTSQFPLGFVTRVFDLLFLESSEVIFRVAIALLDIHKDGLMLCDSFEEIMEYLKHKMPNIDKVMLDKVIKLAFTLDFGRQLNEYHVEYNVLQEEMAAIAPKMQALAKLEVRNKDLMKVNRHISDQLETEVFKVSALQASHSRLEHQVKSLEQTVASLARYIGTTHDKKRDSELPSDVRKLCLQVQQTDRKTFGVLGQKLGQSFASKFSTTDFTEDSSSDPDDSKARKPGILKTGLSTPNLFHKNVVIDPTKKEDVNAKIKNNVAFSEPDLDKKKQYLSLQKSYSCNAGLMAGANKNQEQKVDKSKESKQNDNGVNAVNKLSGNLKGYPLRVLNEDFEYIENEKPKDVTNKHDEALKSSKYSDASSIASSVSSGGKSPTSDDSGKQKSSGFFAHSHEQIRQEKLQAEQLKKDFDDNLKRLDARLSPQVSQKFSDDGKNHNMMLDPIKVTEKLNNEDSLKISDKKINSGNLLDSGLGTPISPNEKNIHNIERFQLSPQHNNSLLKSGELDLSTIVSNHPLVGCDLDIKFDVHATKLKSLKPSRVGHIGSRTASVESGDSRN